MYGILIAYKINFSIFLILPITPLYLLFWCVVMSLLCIFYLHRKSVLLSHTKLGKYIGKDILSVYFSNNLRERANTVAQIFTDKFPRQTKIEGGNSLRNRFLCTIKSFVVAKICHDNGRGGPFYLGAVNECRENVLKAGNIFRLMSTYHNFTSVFGTASE